MSANDVAPVLARILNRIQAVSDIGLVWGGDLYANDDLLPLVVSDIDDVSTLRAWWVTGPALPEADRLVEIGPAQHHRWWEYTICGAEGVPDDELDPDTGAVSELGSAVALDRLRVNALAVTDRLDADLTLNQTCHRTWPCTWPTAPELRFPVFGLCAYVEIRKRVLTFSSPL